MRALLGFAVINAFFVAMNAFGAVLLYALFKGGQFVAPSAIEHPWVSYPLGIAGLAVTLWLSFKSVRFIERRLARLPARGRA